MGGLAWGGSTAKIQYLISLEASFHKTLLLSKSKHLFFPEQIVLVLAAVNDDGGGKTSLNLCSF